MYNQDTGITGTYNSSEQDTDIIGIYNISEQDTGITGRVTSITRKCCYRVTIFSPAINGNMDMIVIR